MSLRYDLDNKTNADLEADGYADDLFGYLCLMMVTKVGRLDEEGKTKFIARVAEYAVVSEYTKDTLPRIIRMTNYLTGMTTNIMTESDAKWKAHLHTLVKDRAAELLRCHTPSTDH